MWRLTRTSGILLPMPALYSAVMCRAFLGTWKTWQWLCLSTIYCFALRPWSRTGVIYQSIWSSCPVLCRDGMPRASGMAAYVRDRYGSYRQPKFELGYCEMQVLMVCGAIQNFYVFSLVWDLDELIYECWLTTMAAMQAVDDRASFLFMGDLNGHH